MKVFTSLVTVKLITQFLRIKITTLYKAIEKLIHCEGGKF